jgi:hypothetical protein
VDWAASRRCQQKGCSSGFLPGCQISACFLYAFFITSSSAVLSTPSTSYRQRCGIALCPVSVHSSKQTDHGVDSICDPYQRLGPAH